MRKPFTPREWQPAMSGHLLQHDRCALWARMGSGKTVVVGKRLKQLAQLSTGPALVVAPKRVANHTWPDEFNEWDCLSGMTVKRVTGDLTSRLRALDKLDADVYTTNFEQLPWLVRFYGKNWPFRTVVVDEATRLKGHRGGGQGGQRTNSFARVAHRHVDNLIELTGTPSPNGIKDLWGQLWFIDGGQRLGRTHTDFKHRWFRPAENGFGVEPLPGAQKEIEALIGDVCLSVDPADYFPLEPVIESEVRIELPTAARAAYRDMEEEMFLELEHAFGTHEIEAANAAARTNKCLQLAAGFVYHDDKRNWTELHREKLDALGEIIEEANGAPVLVSYIYKADLARIKKRFPQARSIDDDKDTIAQWNAGKIELMCAHPQSAGHGLSLQHGGNILADFTSGWDLEYDDQIIERLGPMRQYQSGYDRPVYRYRIIADRTVDDLVAYRRSTKRTVQEILFEAMKRRSK